MPRSRMLGAIPLLPQYVFMAWCLVKHRDNFTFTLHDVIMGDHMEARDSHYAYFFILFINFKLTFIRYAKNS
jgi:hypothetical protein